MAIFCSATPPPNTALEFLADHCPRPLYSHSVPSPTPGRCPPLSPLCPLPALLTSPLINRRWYWWELNAGKWLPVKAPRTPASHPACNRIQAWLACWPFTMPVNRSLCSFAGPVLHSVSPSICLPIILFLSVPTSALVRSLFQDAPGSVNVSLLCLSRVFLFATCWCLSISVVFHI